MSQLTFLGASLAKSSYEEWKAWRARQQAEFVPFVAIQSPWGVAAHTVGSTIFQPDYGVVMGWSCQVMVRVKMPADVRAKIRKIWGRKTPPKFWFRHEVEKLRDYEKFAEMLKSPNWRGEGFRAGRIAYGYGGGFLTRGFAADYPDSARYPGEYYPLYDYRKEEGGKCVI